MNKAGIRQFPTVVVQASFVTRTSNLAGGTANLDLDVKCRRRTLKVEMNVILAYGSSVLTFVDGLCRFKKMATKKKKGVAGPGLSWMTHWGQTLKHLLSLTHPNTVTGLAAFSTKRKPLRRARAWTSTVGGR